MRTYEGLYILDDGLRDEELEAALDRVHNEITRLEGRIVSTLPLGRKTFARPIGKRETGLYFRILFELVPDQIATLRSRYRINESVVRVQIVIADEPVQATAMKSAE